jgi:hypothetical protein
MTVVETVLRKDLCDRVPVFVKTMELGTCPILFVKDTVCVSKGHRWLRTFEIDDMDQAVCKGLE